jgi:hypothetical protein
LTFPAAQNQDKAAQIDALMAEQNFEKKPGAAVLVIENGRTVYQKGFGAADLENGQIDRARHGVSQPRLAVHAACDERNRNLHALCEDLPDASVQFTVQDGPRWRPGSSWTRASRRPPGCWRCGRAGSPPRPGRSRCPPSLAERLGARIGDEVRPEGAPVARVVGIAAQPDCRSCRLAAGLPGWTGTAPADGREDLVDLPAGAVADRELQRRLAGAGVLLVPRDARLHPERWGEPAGGTDGTSIAIVVLIAGIGLLESCCWPVRRSRSPPGGRCATRRWCWPTAAGPPTCGGCCWPREP